MTGGSRNPLPERYAAFVRARGGVPRAVYPSDALPAAAELDMLLLCGGLDVHPARFGMALPPNGSVEPDAARDAMEWALLDSFIKAGKPVYGICRGLQVLNVYFGGTLIPDLPPEGRARHTGRADAPLYHPVRTDAGTELLVNSFHHQAVDRLAPDLRAAAWSADGLAEAVRHATLPIAAVQWHPERLDKPDAWSAGW